MLIQVTVACRTWQVLFKTTTPSPPAPATKQCCGPLAEKCLTECLMYHAQVDRSDISKSKNYFGTCEKYFKESQINHTSCFRNKNKGKSTDLSKQIQELKTNSINYNFKQSSACKAHPHTGTTTKCDLCNKMFSLISFKMQAYE